MAYTALRRRRSCPFLLRWGGGTLSAGARRGALGARYDIKDFITCQMCSVSHHSIRQCIASEAALGQCPTPRSAVTTVAMGERREEDRLLG